MHRSPKIAPRILLMTLLLMSALALGYVSIAADEATAPAGGTLPPPPPTGVPPAPIQFQPIIFNQPTIVSP